MDLLCKIIVSVLCSLLFWLFFRLQRHAHKDSIVEAGYRNDTCLRKPQSKKLPLWDRLLYWDLCKNARRNHKAVWFYFGCNAVLCAAWIFYPVLCLLCICFADLRSLLLWELEYPIGIFFILTIVEFPADLTYLPSERKRHGLDKKKKH